MAIPAIGDIGGLSKTSMTVMQDMFQLMSDLMQMASPAGGADGGLQQSLLSGLRKHQAAADQVQPADGTQDAAGDRQDPLQGLMQAMTQLIQMVMPLLGGDSGPSPTTASNDVADAIKPASPVPTKPAPVQPDAPAPVSDPVTPPVPDPVPTPVPDPVSDPVPVPDPKPGAITKPDTLTPPTLGFAAKDPAIDRWAPDIDKAAQATGLDPNLIGGQMWAESRGRPETVTTNIDGTQDLGLMQIGQERWLRDIVPGLSAQDRAAIKTATGKDAEQLNMADPHDNVIGGAFHLKQYIDQHDGDVTAGLEAYVGIGDEGIYAKHVLANQAALAAGQNMDANQ